MKQAVGERVPNDAEGAGGLLSGTTKGRRRAA
jgi:hypothetical protein